MAALFLTKRNIILHLVMKGRWKMKLFLTLPMYLLPDMSAMEDYVGNGGSFRGIQPAHQSSKNAGAFDKENPVVRTLSRYFMVWKIEIRYKP